MSIEYPMYRFIADFYCPKIKLAIGVDGRIHELPENKQYDIGRTELLKFKSLKKAQQTYKIITIKDFYV